jgi:hypothetical protein
MRFNNPKESSPQDVGRLIATVMLNALKNVETQRNGVVLINDLSGIGVKNLSPSTVKYIMGEVYCPRSSSRTRTRPFMVALTRSLTPDQVLPALPIRVHRILLVRPPWFITRSVSKCTISVPGAGMAELCSVQLSCSA